MYRYEMYRKWKDVLDFMHEIKEERRQMMFAMNIYSEKIDN